MAKKPLPKIQKKQPSKSKKRPFLKIVFIILCVLAVLTLVALLVETSIITNPIDSVTKETRQIEIEDACSIIGGRLIHTVSDEGSCRNKCIVQCEAEGRDYQESEFTQVPNNCNQCACSCR